MVDPAFDRLLVVDAPSSSESRLLAAVPAWIAPALIVLLGFLLRLHDLRRLSLWLDEVYVVDYIRMPWRKVLGFEGGYDNHPPLYFAIVKLTSAFTSETDAARIVSLICGTATVAAVFLLVDRLSGYNAALLSSLIVALSPLLAWYSQEGRMYAPTCLCVTLSYYALIRFLPDGNRRWGVAYGATLVLAMYLDYSAAYALAPQIAVVFALSTGRRRQVFTSWLKAVVAAALLFAPWALQVVRSIQFVGDDRAFLYVTQQKVVDSFYTLVGLPGERTYYWGTVTTPWVEWPEIRPVAAALVALVLVLAVATLSGRYRLTLVVGGALFLGTMLTAAFASYFLSPGYADRTISYGVIGWAILAGSMPFGRAPNGGRTLGLATVATLLVFSTMGLYAIDAQGDKEHYRELAAATDDAQLMGIPIVATERPEKQLIADSTGLVRTALSTYHPGLDPDSVEKVDGLPAFWHVYTEYPWEVEGIGEMQNGFADLGFARVDAQLFQPVLHLDLYVNEALDEPDAVSLSTWADDLALKPGEPGWTLLPESSYPETVDGRDQLLVYASDEGAAAELVTTATAGNLYLVTFEERTDLAVGSGMVGLECRSAEGEVVATSNVDFAPDLGETGIWQRLRAGVVCPQETTGLSISLANTAFGDLRFRNLTLSEIAPQTKLVLIPEWARPSDLF